MSINDDAEYLPFDITVYLNQASGATCDIDVLQW